MHKYMRDGMHALPDKKLRIWPVSSGLPECQLHGGCSCSWCPAGDGSCVELIILIIHVIFFIGREVLTVALHLDSILKTLGASCTSRGEELMLLNTRCCRRTTVLVKKAVCTKHSSGYGLLVSGFWHSYTEGPATKHSRR